MRNTFALITLTVNTKTCKTCGKEFVRKWPYQIKKAIFCSHQCANSVLWENHVFTEEHKEKLLAGRAKYKYTTEAKAKMSAMKQNYIPWNKGIAMWFGEAKKNLVIPKAKYGIEHPNWKGGLSVLFVRKQRIEQNGGSHTKQEWENLKEQYNFMCPSCYKSEPEIKLSLDHITPISKGGSNNIENIQPLCRSCNAKKHVKTIKYELAPTY